MGGEGGSGGTRGPGVSSRWDWGDVFDLPSPLNSVRRETTLAARNCYSLCALCRVLRAACMYVDGACFACGVFSVCSKTGPVTGERRRHDSQLRDRPRPRPILPRRPPLPLFAVLCALEGTAVCSRPAILGRRATSPLSSDRQVGVFFSPPPVHTPGFSSLVVFIAPRVSLFFQTANSEVLRSHRTTTAMHETTPPPPYTRLALYRV